MKNVIVNVFATALFVSTCAVSAATTTGNTDDGSAIGTADSPQVKQQDKRMDKKPMNKSQRNKNSMTNRNNDLKMMDADNNGIVSKDEYTRYYDKMYDEMKPGTDGISYRNSMNNKPIGTTTGVSPNGSVDVTKEGEPVNGTTTGTNR